MTSFTEALFSNFSLCHSLFEAQKKWHLRKVMIQAGKFLQVTLSNSELCLMLHSYMLLDREKLGSFLAFWYKVQ